jgi:hypothetical protein
MRQRRPLRVYHIQKTPPSGQLRIRNRRVPALTRTMLGSPTPRWPWQIDRCVDDEPRHGLPFMRAQDVRLLLAMQDIALIAHDRRRASREVANRAGLLARKRERQVVGIACLGAVRTGYDAGQTR